MRRDGAGKGREAVQRGRHVLGVERSGDRQRHDAGLGRRFGLEVLELLERARGDDLAGAVHVGGGEALGLEVGDDLALLAAHDGAHAGGGDGGRVGHSGAALTHEHHGLLGREDARGGSCGDLTDAVARTGADRTEALDGVLEQREKRDEPARDDEGLRDGRVFDGGRVGLGAVVHEVHTRAGRQPGHAGAEIRQLKPRAKETGGLGALSRAHDRKHGSTLPGLAPALRPGGRRTSRV